MRNPTERRRRQARPTAGILVDALAAAVLLCCLAVLPCGAPAAAPGPATRKTPILSETTIADTLAGRNRNCYVYTMDAPTTKAAVYWGEPRFNVRLEPCAGLPHMAVSVYGCPSEGHQVNWEFMSTQMRNDLRTSGKRLPPLWEWPGDVETLDIDATHKTFYIEVTNWVRPIRTPGEHIELERQLRTAGFAAEADIVKSDGDMAAKKPVVVTGTEGYARFQTSRAALFQDLLMPQSQYQITVVLYDWARAKKNALLPMTNREGFVRDIENLPHSARPLQFTDDPTAGHYYIAFWPPTNSVNDSQISAPGSGNATSTNFSGLRRDEPARQLLAHVGDGGGRASQVRYGDDIMSANPAAEGMGAGGLTGWSEMQRLEAQLQAQEHLDARLKRTEQRLAQLAASDLEGVALAVSAAHARYFPRGEEATTEGDAWGRRREGVNWSEVNEQGQVTGGGGRRAGEELTLYQKAAYKTQPEDIEYQLYSLDITDDVVERWGKMVDPQLGETRARVLDQPCGAVSSEGEDLGELQCGVKQWIARVQFAKLDRDNDGYVSSAEYDLEYPADVQTSGDRRAGFKQDWTFSRAASNGTDNGISKASWDAAFDPEPILLANIKDPLKRTFWTVCGVRKIGSPISREGVADGSTLRPTWLNVTSFEQLEDRRFRYTILGLNDTYNRIYLLNAIARNTKTGEELAYKVHAVQRKVAVYEPPPLKSDQVGLLTGIAVISVTVAVIVIVAFAVNSNKKMRPRLRVRQSK